MIRATCIQKHRDDKNNIVGYRLKDLINGGYTDIGSKELKIAIQKNQIIVDNLKLTSNNALITVKSDRELQDDTFYKSCSDSILKDMLDKARATGEVKEIPTYCKHKCYLIYKSSNNHIILIPSDVTHLNANRSSGRPFTENIKNLKGTIVVYGGTGLKNVDTAFAECEAEFINLRYFDTPNVVSMKAMFANCKAKQIDLTNFKTSNVKNMRLMFCNCKINNLDLSSFDTSNLTNAHGMFNGCTAEHIDLSNSNINTHKIRSSQFSIFSNCNANLTTRDEYLIAAYKWSAHR